jgi:hypothetical protein
VCEGPSLGVVGKQGRMPDRPKSAPNILTEFAPTNPPNSLMATTLKCLSSRPVTGLRPPPGGPMAATSLASTTWRQLLSEQSYLLQVNVMSLFLCVYVAGWVVGWVGRGA